MTKVALLGAKGTTLDLLHYFLNTKTVIFDCVISLGAEHPSSENISNYCPEITEYAKKNGIKCYEVKSYSLNDSADVDFFFEEKFDIVFVIGWERLLPVEVLETITLGAFGMHGSPFGLPRGRGRSPLNWSLINGYSTFRTSLFQYSPAMDDGPIVGSKTFTIHDHDDISSLHQKNRIAMCNLISEYKEKFFSKQLDLVEQPSGLTTYFPKRVPDDGFIDWYQSTADISRMISALKPPYPCARSIINGNVLMLLDAAPFDDLMFDEKATPGEILDVSYAAKTAVIKTGSGSILIKSIGIDQFDELKAGSVLLSIDMETTLSEIRKRYPSWVKANQREV